MLNLESGLSWNLDYSAPQVPVETRCGMHVRIPQDAMKTRSIKILAMNNLCDGLLVSQIFEIKWPDRSM